MPDHTTLVTLGPDSYGVYAVGHPFAQGPYGTPLLFRGTFLECQAFQRTYRKPEDPSEQAAA
jgi:hypothetical protein